MARRECVGTFWFRNPFEGDRETPANHDEEERDAGDFCPKELLGRKPFLPFRSVWRCRGGGEFWFQGSEWNRNLWWLMEICCDKGTTVNVLLGLQIRSESCLVPRLFFDGYPKRDVGTFARGKNGSWVWTSRVPLHGATVVMRDLKLEVVDRSLSQLCKRSIGERTTFSMSFVGIRALDNCMPSWINSLDDFAPFRMSWGHLTDLGGASDEPLALDPTELHDWGEFLFPNERF